MTKGKKYLSLSFDRYLKDLTENHLGIGNWWYLYDKDIIFFLIAGVWWYR